MSNTRKATPRKSTRSPARKPRLAPAAAGSSKAPSRRRIEGLMASVLTVDIGEDHYEVALGDLGPADDRICRAQTGVTFMGLIDRVVGGDQGMDTLAAVVWLARRKSGEAGLVLGDVEEELNNWAAIDAANIRLDLVEGDPEG